MAPWVPQTELWWVASLTTGVITLLFLVFLPRFSTQISVDIMEFCDPASLKDAAKNVWTNVAVVGALLLTVLITMLQLEPGSAAFADASEVEEQMATLQELYIAYVLASLAFVLISLFTCVVNLTYVEPLRNSAAVKYFIANPNSFGSPVMLLMASCVFLKLALVMWVFRTYGLPNGILTCILCVVTIGVLGWYIRDKSTFDPTGKTAKSWEWQWTQRPQSEWPKWVFAPDAKTAAVFRTLGSAAQLLEQEEIRSSAVQVLQAGSADGAAAGKDS